MVFLTTIRYTFYSKNNGGHDSVMKNLLSSLDLGQTSYENRPTKCF